ncbi:MAG: AAA family ATPase [Gemmatimonadetes bacterium]|nr:sigma 54-interacting transcriptional regulator [Gemmatimonadota bacterium]MYA42775.1 AAA family ATPase [Gemmatimonadota bacterium]MYE94793.1 AAA family ATPase [Gemmatimonadota bacterium]MYJ10832.1 AAA family ATPase [Gemmatimonadota bacterium]
MHPAADQTELAQDIRRRSLERWGPSLETVLVGRDESLQESLRRLVRFAAAESPVLITGETGTGKELFARALYLKSLRSTQPFLSVNCAQYLGDQLVASELFGHKRGSFTGAVSDHRGVFQDADGGIVFLDEIGDLPHAGQAMLLRVISEGEIVPVGGTRTKQVDVRVVAATNRSLDQMVAKGNFRKDLYYRLQCLRVAVPPLRDRGNDWSLIAEHFLRLLGQARDTVKVLSGEARRTLANHPWPGNVREVRGCVETGFYLSETGKIHTVDFWEALEHDARTNELDGVPLVDPREYCDRLCSGEVDFWTLVHRSFMDREINRTQVRAMIAEGLRRSLGSYKGAAELFGVKPGQYLKFMDFLRHHRLKPMRRHSHA